MSDIPIHDTSRVPPVNRPEAAQNRDSLKRAQHARKPGGKKPAGEDKKPQRDSYDRYQNQFVPEFSLLGIDAEGAASLLEATLFKEKDRPGGQGTAALTHLKSALEAVAAGKLAPGEIRGKHTARLSATEQAAQSSLTAVLERAGSIVDGAVAAAYATQAISGDRMKSMANAFVVMAQPYMANNRDTGRQR